MLNNYVQMWTYNFLNPVEDLSNIHPWMVKKKNSKKSQSRFYGRTEFGCIQILAKQVLKRG